MNHNLLMTSQKSVNASNVRHDLSKLGASKIHVLNPEDDINRQPYMEE
jgi:hypothetical protein